ncbi:hypothetical protein ACFX1S_018668 [Malus domestica]
MLTISATSLVSFVNSLATSLSLYLLTVIMAFPVISSASCLNKSLSEPFAMVCLAAKVVMERTPTTFATPLPRNGERFPEMNGELCYLLTRNEEYANTLDIYSDQDMSLKHMIVLGLESFNNFNKELTALSCVNNEVMIFDFGKRLHAYILKKGKAKILRSGDGTDVDGYVRYIPYMNNLVHIHPSYMSSILSVDPGAKLAS